MNRRIRHRGRFDDDVIEIATWIARDNLDAAMRFIAAAQASADGLLMFPFSGRERRVRAARHRGIRSLPIHGFTDYAILYRPTDEGIILLRVWNGRRQLHPADLDVT